MPPCLKKKLKMEKNPQKIRKAAKKEPPDEDLEIDEEMKDLCREFLRFCEFVGVLLALYLGLKLLVYVVVSLGTMFFGCGTVVVEVDRYANESGVWMSSDFMKHLGEVDDYYENLFRQTCSEKRDGFRYIYRNDLFTLFHIFFINLHITECCLFSDSIVFLKPMFQRWKLM